MQYFIQKRKLTGVRNDQDKPPSFSVKTKSYDDCDPQKWSQARKSGVTFIAFWIVFVCGWASAADSASISKAAVDLHVSQEVESLATAMFLLGIAFGALASGPISETIGRTPAYLIFMVLYMIMVLITSLVPNFGVQVTCRFFSGLFASPPLTIYGGGLADLYDNQARSMIWPIFALSPILGGFVMQSHMLSWRWVDWITLIISGIVFTIAALFLPETFAPILLKWKAAGLRESTGDRRFKSSIVVQSSLTSRLQENVCRPIIFFTSEPIIICLGLYMTLITVLVFTFMTGFTPIFVDTYGFSQAQRGLAFLSIAAGVLLNATTTTVYGRISSGKIHAKERNDLEAETIEEKTQPAVSPEQRLIPALIVAPLLPFSLFWLGFTNNSSMSPWFSLAACSIFGFSLMGIFISSYEYIIDSYETDSASAMSSITFLRYFVASGMVFAAMPMYEAMGVKWVMILMGSLGTVLVPVPLLFWWKGKAIRGRSRFARKY